MRLTVLLFVVIQKSPSSSRRLLGANKKNAPLVTTYSPSQNEINVQPSADIVLTFHAGGENQNLIKAGTGSIVLTPSTGSAVSIDVADSQVTISAAVATVDPTSDLSAGELYTVTMDSGVFTHKNDAALIFAGITGTTYRFTTANAAAITSYSPPLDANTIKTSAEIVLTFSADMQAGTGSIVLTPSTGSAVSIDVDDSQVTFSAAVVTVNPTGNLNAGELYTVTVGSGVLKDASNVDFGGITGTTYQFTTASPDTTEQAYCEADGTNFAVISCPKGFDTIGSVNNVHNICGGCRGVYHNADSSLQVQRDWL